jgi:hypothetical protein
VEMRVFFEVLSSPLCVDYLGLKVKLFDQRHLEVLVELTEIDPCIIVLFA